MLKQRLRECTDTLIQTHTNTSHKATLNSQTHTFITSSHTPTHESLYTQMLSPHIHTRHSHTTQTHIHSHTMHTHMYTIRLTKMLSHTQTQSHPHTYNSFRHTHAHTLTGPHSHTQSSYTLSVPQTLSAHTLKGSLVHTQTHTHIQMLIHIPNTF